MSLSNISLEALKITILTDDILTSKLSSKGQLLFESRKYGKIFQYYQKSPPILAQQYINDSKSLTVDEIERLSYEAGHTEKKILEISTHPDDPILAQINDRLVLELPSGYKLHL